MLHKLFHIIKKRIRAVAFSFSTGLLNVLPFAWDDLLIILIDKIEKRQDVFYSLHARPQKTSDIGTYSDNLCESHDKDCAVVIQGPIARENDFTLETIRLYRKHYPQAKIIVSTWISEEDNYTESFNKEGVELIFNEPPKISGFWNINYQVTSTRAGISLAKELGALYVMKTRSDQRFYETNLLDYFVTLSNQFPLTSAVQVNQRSRLIVLSIGTCKYRAYAVSDLFMFGTLYDVAEYWDVPYDERIHKKRRFINMMEEIRFRNPEIYFVENYMKKHNRDLTFTIKDSWDILAKHFCVVDESMLDFYWRKYMPNKEYRYKYYDENKTSEMVTFKEWLLVYNDKIIKNIDEKILFKHFGEKI